MGFKNIHVVINLGSGKSSVDVDMIRSRLETSQATFRIALIEPDSGPKRSRGGRSKKELTLS